MVQGGRPASCQILAGSGRAKLGYCCYPVRLRRAPDDVRRPPPQASADEVRVELRVGAVLTPRLQSMR
eukprot:3148233-Lingulodinium_polyedra.AAC.1